MKTIAIKLSDELLAEIRNVAQKRGETRSAVVRQALEQCFSLKDHRETRTCLDLARDLAGSFQGPEDLSTSPAHMDGYGR
jgi:predicted transcriptional regulator